MVSPARLLTAALAVLLTSPAVLSAQTSTDLTLIYVSNMPDMESPEGSGGLAQLSTLLNQSRAQNPRTLFLHGGRALGPSPMGSFDRGVHMVDLLNQLEPDVFGVGQGEFSYSEDELTLRAGEAGFPMISSNLQDTRTGAIFEGLHPWYLLEAGPIRLGVLSLIDPEVRINYLLNRTQVLDPETSLIQAAAQLRARGAHFVVVLTDNAGAYLSQALENGTVQAVIESSLGRDSEIRTQGRGRHIVFGAPDRALVMTLRFSGGRANAPWTWTFEGRFQNLAALSPDGDMQRRIASYSRRLASFLDTEIGVVATRLDTQRRVVRLEETAFANLVSDALRAHGSSEIGFFNTGSIRGNRTYEAGTRFTNRMLKTELPYRNYVVKLEVTGSILLEALENGLSRVEDERGRFPAFSGMTVVYDLQGEPGRRVRDVRIGGRLLEPRRTYTLTTVDFLASGGDDYTMFTRGRRLSLPGETLMSDAVALYMQRLRTVSPVVEGRLTGVSRP